MFCLSNCNFNLREFKNYLNFDFKNVKDSIVKMAKLFFQEEKNSYFVYECCKNGECCITAILLDKFKEKL